MQDPITLYSPSGQKSRRIPAIDAPGWMNAGWSLKPRPLSEQASVEIETKTEESEYSREQTSVEIEAKTEESEHSREQPTKRKVKNATGNALPED